MSVQAVELGSGASVQELVRPQQRSVPEPMLDQLVSFQKSETFDSDTVRERETLVKGFSGQGQAIFQAVDANFREPRSKELEVSQVCEVRCSNFLNQGTPDTNLAQIGEREEIQQLDGAEGTGIEEGSTDVTGFRFSEPCFLRRVLREELGNYGGDHKLLIIAIHAVFLESGFVGFDSASGMRVDGFHLPEEWPSKAFKMPLRYTLPELLGKDNVAESVVLKFQKLGHFLNVYGSLTKNGAGLYHLCLDEYRFAPTIDLEWANCDKNDTVNEDDGLTRSYPENEVFEFWKIVKDGLALPLLIDLCDRAGFNLPACLIRLPMELKFKILESLPGTDIARIGCACSEMRYLASNNDLWKQKFLEEFGGGTGAQGTNNWKVKYVSHWDSKKKRKREMQQLLAPVFTPFYAFWQDPFPFGPLAPMIGRDYDCLPGLGVPFTFAQPAQAFPWFQTRQNFSPNCNLGGFCSYWPLQG